MGGGGAHSDEGIHMEGKDGTADRNFLSVNNSVKVKQVAQYYYHAFIQ